MLKALRLCIFELQSYYEEIGTTTISLFPSGEIHPHFCPYPTSFTKNSKVVHFKYIEILEDDATCVTFRVRITNEVDLPDIVVKFMTRYGMDVYNFLTQHKLALRLWSYGLLSLDNTTSSKQPPAQLMSRLSLGSMQIVMMDYVSVCKDIPPDAHEQIEAVLDKLHLEGYVFSDLRIQNILFDEKEIVKFIDFDWSGQYNMNDPSNSLSARLQTKIDGQQKNVKIVDHYVCYPLNLSRRIEWTEGVENLEPICSQHDQYMLNKLIL